MGQNQLNRQQMVHFECPKYRNPCVSVTFEHKCIIARGDESFVSLHAISTPDNKDKISSHKGPARIC